jgi:type IV pilus assembly protein PilZ
MLPIKKGGGRPGGGMLNHHIKDVQTLYMSYLPFLKNGGLFVPIERDYKLGEEVFILLTLFDGAEKIPVAGKVAWINPKGTSGGRPAGIGVHFADVDNGATRNKIETALAGMLRSEKPTHTM